MSTHSAEDDKLMIKIFQFFFITKKASVSTISMLQEELDKEKNLVKTKKERRKQAKFDIWLHCHFLLIYFKSQQKKMPNCATLSSEIIQYITIMYGEFTIIIIFFYI